MLMLNNPTNEAYAYIAYDGNFHVSSEAYGAVANAEHNDTFRNVAISDNPGCYPASRTASNTDNRAMVASVFAIDVLHIDLSDSFARFLDTSSHTTADTQDNTGHATANIAHDIVETGPPACLSTTIPQSAAPTPDTLPQYRANHVDCAVCMPEISGRRRQFGVGEPHESIDRTGERGASVVGGVARLTKRTDCYDWAGREGGNTRLNDSRADDNEQRRPREAARQ